MRTIKFRAKSTDTGKWVFGSLLSPDKRNNLYRILTEEAEYHEVDPDTIGQFIDLYNYKCVEIYEGDICEFKGELYEVKRECDRLGSYWAETGFILDKIGVDQFISFVETIDYIDFEIQIEIIGNVHDDKELFYYFKGA